MAKKQNWFRQDIKKPLAIIWIVFLILEQGLGVDVRFPFGLDLVVRVGGFISIVVLVVGWIVRKLKEQGRIVERNEKIWEDVPRKQTRVGFEKMIDVVKEKTELTPHELAVLSSEFEKKKKSVGVGYLLWFFFGGLGAHRFYIGDKFNGVLYFALSVGGLSLSIFGGSPIFFVTSGLVGIGLLLDAFGLSSAVKSANDKLEEEILREIQATRDRKD